MPKYRFCKTAVDCVCKAADPYDDRTSFIGAVHRPFSLDTRLGASIIEKIGVVPSTE